MDALCAAIPVARALLRLAESKGPHALTLVSGSKRVHVHALDGELVSITGMYVQPLGDVLLKQSALDLTRHHAALAFGAPRRSVGPWLVRVGAASERSVRSALTLQLRERVSSLLQLRNPELLLRSWPRAARDGFAVSVPLTEVVYASLHGIAGGLAQASLIAHAGSAPQQLTRLGRQLQTKLERSVLAPDWQALTQPARPMSTMVESALLRALGALRDGDEDHAEYSLLLRKQRELRAHVSAHRLLDLPLGAAPEEARRAYRTLAKRLHPDRFVKADPTFVALSTDVMRALSSAHRELMLAHA